MRYEYICKATEIIANLDGLNLIKKSAKLYLTFFPSSVSSLQFFVERCLIWTNHRIVLVEGIRTSHVFVPKLQTKTNKLEKFKNQQNQKNMAGKCIFM